MRGDTTLSRLIPVSLDRLCEVERCLKAPSQQDRQEVCELTSLGQETQLGVLGTPRASLYTRENYKQPHMAESRRLQPMASYKSHAVLYVILRHRASS
jgi:hypothetical protein